MPRMLKAICRPPSPPISRAVVAILCLCAAPVQAEQPASPAGTQEQWLDLAHHRLAESLDASAVWFDSFFSDPRSDEESRADTFARLTLAFGYREDENFDLSPRVHIDAKLPRLSDKLSLVVEGQSEDSIDDTLRARDDPTTLPTDEKDVNVGLRYTVRDDLRQNLSLVVGNPSNPIVGGRFRYLKPLTDDSLLRVTQKLFWQDDEGFGESTRLDLERRLPGDMLARWATNALYSEDSDGVEWKTEGALFRRLSSRAAVKLALSASGETEPATVVDTYRTYVSYRRNFYRSWLFYEVEPELRWPRDEGYDLTPGIIFRLEAQLWE